MKVKDFLTDRIHEKKNFYGEQFINDVTIGCDYRFVTDFRVEGTRVLLYSENIAASRKVNSKASNCCYREIIKLNPNFEIWYKVTKLNKDYKQISEFKLCEGSGDNTLFDLRVSYN